MSDKQQIQAVASEPGAFNERRSTDRRRHSLRTITYCGLKRRGRRHSARRDEHNYYLDWYHPSLVITGLTVMLLSCLDSVLTLTLLSRGAYEANYMMAALLEINHSLFVAVKAGITASCVAFLLMHANFRILRLTNGGRILQLMAVIYGLLIAYEIALLRLVP